MDIPVSSSFTKSTRDPLYYECFAVLCFVIVTQWRVECGMSKQSVSLLIRFRFRFGTEANFL